MKNRKSLFLVLVTVIISILLLAQFTAIAAPEVITDTTATSATNDGTISENEYIECTSGIGAGFGDVLGAGGLLCVDSSDTGSLNFGLIKGAGGLNDAVVIYIDSVEGGFGSTTNFTDEGGDNNDGLRQAISGKDVSSDPSNISVITFAAGFEADYAIAFSQDFGGLWELAENAEHPFITTVNLTPTGTTTSAAYEVNLTLANIGVAQGGNFTYVVTYIAQSAYRSNEFQGVAGPLDGGEANGNFGWNPVTLATGDYNTFNSYSAPSETGTPTATEGTPVATPTATEGTPVETATQSTPAETPVSTATATEVPGTALLSNGSFENKDGEDKPDLTPWILKNLKSSRTVVNVPSASKVAQVKIAKSSKSLTWMA